MNPFCDSNYYMSTPLLLSTFVNMHKGHKPCDTSRLYPACWPCSNRYFLPPGRLSCVCRPCSKAGGSHLKVRKFKLSTGYWCSKHSAEIETRIWPVVELSKRDRCDFQQHPWMLQEFLDGIENFSVSPTADMSPSSLPSDAVIHRDPSPRFK